MSYAVVFSGQGTQHPGMLPWLEDAAEARPVLAALEDCMGQDWRTLLAADACRASNALAQPLIVGTALAAWSALRPLLGQAPEVVAGYSVGEVAAFAAAGVYTPPAALDLARRRARLMDAAVQGHDTGLVAISGIHEAEVLSAAPGVECAIRIDPDHGIFGGDRKALAAVREALQHRAQFKPICVALASHTSWMRSAAEAFLPVVQGAGLRPPESPLALNATGTTSRQVPVLVTALAAQLGQTVEWGACMAAIAERRPACVIEIGGGNALARMWAARYPEVPVRSLDEFRSAEGAAAWVLRQG
ncbi:acyltransferase domain-containing protein [Ramlibacter alkalitolerans]|uniref:Acyltransferase domain-containing protein n=1 Tax=Ramlibacter alkalitolerans TaxID=2039631 RepID=A0ABS1JM81_9BURK|nr:acyltransferase domain-containing protein [Ramlibacter alkalitolerans]MBL0425313.1 acyltransferase domain-containing protein [Ramlibacter alkalitolerans]